MNKKEIRALIREAFQLDEKRALFQNINFGGEIGAPEEIPDSLTVDKNNKENIENSQLSSSLNPDKTARQKIFVVVSTLIHENARQEMRRRRSGNIQEFSNLFAQLNMEYDKIRDKALVELRDNKKISINTNKSFKIISDKIKNLLKINSPKSLSDKRVIDWFQIK
jgi:hypothetical protein